ncbi:MAG: hypothetical protein Q4F72_05320, partial [Desulfovibrionaceae bacterium]|nr:hypothetical protein [Desulfovibrionaceae bacterium]
MSSETMTLCLCGEYHPLGYVCEKARELAGLGRDSEKNHEHAHEDSCCCHEHEHEYAHHHENEDACCCHEHAQTDGHEQEDACCHERAAAVRTASDTLAIFHIEAMDCPVEEKLIRDRLSAMEGVKKLTFDL